MISPRVGFLRSRVTRQHLVPDAHSNHHDAGRARDPDQRERGTKALTTRGRKGIALASQPREWPRSDPLTPRPTQSAARTCDVGYRRVERSNTTAPSRPRRERIIVMNMW